MKPEPFAAKIAPHISDASLLSQLAGGLLTEVDYSEAGNAIVFSVRFDEPVDPAVLEKAEQAIQASVGFGSVRIAAQYPDDEKGAGPAAERKAAPRRPRKRKYDDLPIESGTERVLLGGLIRGKPLPIDHISHDSGRVNVFGEIFDVKEIKTRDGNSVIFEFCIADATGSFAAKAFVSIDDARRLSAGIVPGKGVIVRGTVQNDRFYGDYLINAESINLVELIPKSDTAEHKRVELHAHTNMSALDAVIPAKALIKQAYAYGHSAVAITDHGCVQSFPEAADKLSKDYPGMKVIYGMEAYLAVAEPVVCGVSAQALQGNFVVFDIETTGLNFTEDRIIEIGAVKFGQWMPGETFSSFVNPGKVKLTPEIISLTGIDHGMLQDAPKEKQVLADFLRFCGDAVLVAHNARFDINFVKAACRRNGIIFQPVFIDTLTLSRALVPDKSNYRLETVAKYFGVDDFGHHRALNDAEVLTKILKGLFELASEEGIDDLEQLRLLSMRVDPRARNTYHMILLVRDYTGLKNLYRLVSRSNCEFFKRFPRIPEEILGDYREGLLLGSACEAGELFRAFLEGEDDETIEAIAEKYDYLEIQPAANSAHLIRENRVKNEEAIRAINKKIVGLAQRLGKLVVATGDVHFLKPEDAVFREILLDAQGYSDADAQPPLYFRTTAEMLDEFDYLGREDAYETVVTNTNRIAGMIEEITPLREEQYRPKIEGSTEKLKSICDKRVAELYGDPLPEYVRDRYDKELGSILKNDFAMLYIVAQMLVDYSELHGYHVGSRGSVGSSLTAFLTGTSEVNPLAPHYLCPACRHSEFFLDGSVGSGYDLPAKDCPRCGVKMLRDGQDIPFETFLGFAGEKVPDIDLNFSGEFQAKAHKYTEEIFGSDNVFKAGTILTVAEKTAYGYVKKWAEEKGKSLPRSEENRLKMGITGVKRTTSQHPGGMVIIPSDMEIEDFTPVQFPADDEEKNTVTTHFDFDSLHDTILKLDILGHVMPTMFKRLEDMTGVKTADVDIFDPAIYTLFRSPEPLGITPEDIECETGTLFLPEMGTKKTIGIILEAKPKNFADLMQISGLSHGTDVWNGNAQSLIRNGICTISEVIGTRDSIMTYLIRKGVRPSSAFKIMEMVRKGKAADQLTAELKNEMRAAHVPEWYIESCVKIKYMFPKAHAAAYVLDALRHGWYKIYYPVEFYAVYMSLRTGDLGRDILSLNRVGLKKKIRELRQAEQQRKASAKDKERLLTLELVNEAAARNIAFLPVDLKKSKAEEYIIENGSLRLPFSALPGVGPVAARKLYDFLVSCGGEVPGIDWLKKNAGISKTVVEALEGAGALLGIPAAAPQTGREDDMAASGQLSLF